jgi:uncharacterized RDD family membrane protein YckC
VTDYPWHTAPPPVLPATRGAGLQGRRAGVVTRSLANAADVAVVVLVLVGGWLGVAAVRFLLHPAAFTFPSPGGRALLLIGLGLLAGYFAVTWAVVGGTYGDRLLGLRVIGPDGERQHWGRSALRAVLCVAFPIGLFWAAVSQDNRSVQDLLLRTSVVYDWTAA